MSVNKAMTPRLEQLLAEMLQYGTWIASAAIAIGLALPFIGGYTSNFGVMAAPKMTLVTAGIALFIFLPVMRVILMLIVFFQDRDYRLSAIAALVLVIIALGFVLGTLPSFRP